MDIQNCWYRNHCKYVDTPECSKSCIRYNCMISLYKASMIPESMWNMKSLACEDGDYNAFLHLSDICKNISHWVKQGRNIYIYSETCGNGKTSWSIKIMHSYFDSIWHLSGFNCHGLFLNVPKLLYDHKRNINQEVEGFEQLCSLIGSVDLVIWDDLPSRTLSEYEHQVLLQFIDQRVNAGLSNIFTGNCDRVGCTQRLGDRLTSRVFGDDCVKFIENDKRGMKNG